MLALEGFNAGVGVEVLFKILLQIEASLAESTPEGLNLLVGVAVADQGVHGSIGFVATRVGALVLVYCGHIRSQINYK